VPEWNSVANDFEKQATNGSARAILQGRKYGFGCLLVTQRTANVTKSILNQCNTVFGMRVYDATGMGFLENYIGPTHAHLLASLRDRQAVIFGRASSCNSPVIVDLNDTALFLKGFWEAHANAVPISLPPVVGGAVGDGGESVSISADDEIPF
jgi:DNA helicase HerA-like ATPase